LLDKLMSLGHAVGCGTALQAGRSRVQFPMVSLEFFIDIWPRKIAPGVKADTTFMYRLSRNMGSSTSCNPLGLKSACTGYLD
jgi:hypothetical protein